MVLHSHILTIIGFCLTPEAFLRMALSLQHHKTWKTCDWPTELYSNIYYSMILLTTVLYSDKITIATDLGNYPKVWDQLYLWSMHKIFNYNEWEELIQILNWKR